MPENKSDKSKPIDGTEITDVPLKSKKSGAGDNVKTHKPATKIVSSVKTTKNAKAKTAEFKSEGVNCLIKKETYNLLVTNLSALFLYNKTISLIKQDESFQSVICEYINAIYTYENQTKVNDEQIDSFLVAYKTIVGKPYDPIIIDANKIDDLDDKISYLNIYIRNTLKMEWSDIIFSFKTDTKKIDPDSLIKMAEVAGATNNVNNESVNNTNDAQQSNKNFQQNKPFNSEEFLRQNNVNFDQMADIAIMNTAKMHLYDKVLKNEFFVFDSKPSFFVWTKWIYLIGVIVFSIVLLATYIFQLIPMSDIFVFGNIPTGMTPAENATWLLNNSNYYYSAKSTTNLFTIILSVLLVCLLAYNIFKNAWKEIKFRNNDNYRFSCSFIPIVFLVFALFWLYLIPLISNANIHPLTWLQKVLANPNIIGNITVQVIKADKTTDTLTFAINNPGAYNSMVALSVLNIMLLTLGGIGILASLGIKLVAPKKNYDSINNTISETISDIKNNRIDLARIQEQTNSLQQNRAWQARFSDIRRFL